MLADRYLNDGNVALFASGTGNPLLHHRHRCSAPGVEIEADAVLLAKNVDGVYSADPNLDPTAVKKKNFNRPRGSRRRDRYYRKKSFLRRNTQ